MNPLPFHKALQPLAWLKGTWITETLGTGIFPTIKSFKYCEQLTFASIGQPMLNYCAQSWDPEKKNPMHQEVGFLKIIPETNRLNFIVAHNFGMTSVEEGEVKDQEIRLSSTNISRPTSGTKHPIVTEIKREFKLVGDKLEQVVYMATESMPELSEHLRITYKKVEG